MKHILTGCEVDLLHPEYKTNLYLADAKRLSSYDSSSGSLDDLLRLIPEFKTKLGDWKSQVFHKVDDEYFGELATKLGYKGAEKYIRQEMDVIERLDHIRPTHVLVSNRLKARLFVTRGGTSITRLISMFRLSDDGSVMMARQGYEIMMTIADIKEFSTMSEWMDFIFLDLLYEVIALLEFGVAVIFDLKTYDWFVKKLNLDQTFFFIGDKTPVFIDFKILPHMWGFKDFESRDLRRQENALLQIYKFSTRKFMGEVEFVLWWLGIVSGILEL